MKIAITGDNHIFFAHNTQQQIKDMMKNIKKQNPDVIINLGDMGELLLNEGKAKILNPLLNSCPPTLYVMGNHDLFALPRMPPDLAMSNYLKLLKHGTPLQKSWTDTKTIFMKDDCVFCGVMGWPDFLSPRLMYPPLYYNEQCCTADERYIDISLGWKHYGQPHFNAFEQKLIKAVSTPLNNVIIATHYSIFDSQYFLSKTETISAYFFCHTIGEIVKRVALQHPNKKFFCFSAHGHDYNAGRWGAEGINISTFGLTTTYYTQDYIMFDTTKS